MAKVQAATESKPPASGGAGFACAPAPGGRQFRRAEMVELGADIALFNIVASVNLVTARGPVCGLCCDEWSAVVPAEALPHARFNQSIDVAARVRAESLLDLRRGS